MEVVDDGYQDDGTIPEGYLYKVIVPVFRNRSMETVATLLNSENAVKRKWRSSGGIGRNAEWGERDERSFISSLCERMDRTTTILDWR